MRYTSRTCSGMIAIEAQDWGSNSKAPFRIAELRMVLSSSADAGARAVASAATAA